MLKARNPTGASNARWFLGEARGYDLDQDDRLGEVRRWGGSNRSRYGEIIDPNGAAAGRTDAALMGGVGKILLDIQRLRRGFSHTPVAGMPMLHETIISRMVLHCG